MLRKDTSMVQILTTATRRLETVRGRRPLLLALSPELLNGFAHGCRFVTCMTGALVYRKVFP